MNEGIQTSPGGGLRVWFDIHYVHEAERFLRERGIAWDDTHRDRCRRCPWGRNEMSPIIYFRKGDTEVAYLVDGMGLAIFDTPRRFR